MTTTHIRCPNCCASLEVELEAEEFHRLVASNREAAMQALGVRKSESALRPRFRMTPFVEHQPDGSHKVGMRRAN